jgi:copper homeostasis protein (lipoprotein)
MRTFCYLFFASILLTTAATASALAAPPLKVPAVYRGQLPCADCPGIVMTLRLNANGTFSGRYVYIDRSSSFVEHGTWKYDAASGMLTLQPWGGSAESWRGGNDEFRMQNSDLKRVTSAQENPSLEGTTWSLVTLEGTHVTVAADHSAPTMTFNKEDSRVSGTGGCNNFNGGFTTTASGGLTLTGVASTRMFCIGDMETEDRFFMMFDKIHGYRISDGTLYLVAKGGETLATLIPNP